MRTTRLLLALLACHALWEVPGLMAQSRPVADGRIASGTLSFDGHATVGDFVGTTRTVSGQITGGSDFSLVRGWVEAPVRTLTTGNGKRDKDLNKSMESDKYPSIRFELSRIVPKGGTPDSVAAMLEGVLIIHGEARKANLPATLQFQERKAHVRATFPLKLTDYRIGGLSKMFGVLKMYEDIEVHVDLLFDLTSA